MLKQINWTEATDAERLAALARPVETGAAEGAAREIVEAVLARGDSAVREYAARLDGYAPEDFRVPAEAITAARKAMDPADVEAVRAAADAVRRFHVRQGYAGYSVETWTGVTAERRATPIDVAGLYVPAGSAPLVSSLIMLAIPAQLAGVPRIVVVAPPVKGAGVNAALLATAAHLGVDEVYALGGAQAIAALATGSAGLPLADKIFGPGNAYVAAAKSMLSTRAEGPAIDLPAGPSEVMVVADASADPEFVAADLLSQAEHDPNAQVILVSDEADVLARVETALDAQLETLSRALIARAALDNGRFVLASDTGEIADIINTYAPEHLILQTQDPDSLLERVRHAGSVFVGPWTPEAAGDYAAGPNHTLPTGGAARAYGGVTVEAFQKTMTVLRSTAAGAAALAPTVERLAALEGLDAHARAMELRRLKATPDAPAKEERRVRAAARRRKTAETDISVSINLDRDGPNRIDTGIGYFDHMLDQIGRHAGISLQVDVEGDLEIDGHHTIEDVCLTFGETLREALGDKRGIARFGFELPMDESRAGVWIDLSGRPYARFDGQIPGDRVGEFPVEMTAHAFRSIAESLGAAVQVKVEGENAHHMIEACFKAFGRALRQAVRIEGDRLPSTKEALS